MIGITADFPVLEAPLIHEPRPEVEHAWRRIDLESLRKPSIPERIRGFSGAADKLGYWFSKLGLHQVASTLAVEF